ncbi:WGxxGxxG family protein [Gorillibacterium timonense]|uniref:WGxxGxxG family protein n=1 Tax=Gorillibacterium timonense TaxID=1689269 RepID=UPI00071D4801|nr:WGxxGxxG family protein [Gorillibacterium timonense]
MKKLGLALMLLMLVAVMGAGAAFAEGTAAHPVKNVTNASTGILRNDAAYTGNGAGMTGLGLGTVAATPYYGTGVYHNYGYSPSPSLTPTPAGGYGVTGTYNTYNRQNYTTYGTNPYGTGIRTNTYRARAATNGSNWGWLGLLGLFGLAGMRSRNERTVDDRSHNKI